MMGTAVRWFRQLAAGFRTQGARRAGNDEGRAALIAAQRRVGEAMLAYLATQQIDTTALRIEYDAVTDRFTLRGEPADAQARAQVLASCRRVLGAARVHDALDHAAAGATPVVDPYA